MPNDYPPDLQAALGREQPLRGKTTGALSGAFRGLFGLCWRSGTGAEFDLSDARECLLFIRSFIPGSIALQREIAVLECTSPKRCTWPMRLRQVCIAPCAR